MYDGRNLSSEMMILSNEKIPVLLNPGRMFFSLNAWVKP